MTDTCAASFWRGAIVSSSVALFLVGCSDGAPQEAPLEKARGAASPGGTYAAPQPLSRAVANQIWAGLFGAYQRAARLELLADERERVLVGLDGAGFTRAEVTIDGANVIVQDVVFSAEPLVAAWRASGDGVEVEVEVEVEKGKVLAQEVTQLLGLHDTTLVQPLQVIGAPTVYASQRRNDEFLFDRPEVDPSFEHVLVLADDVPEAIFAAFRGSIAEIGNASPADCLGPTFLEVLSRSEFDARFAGGPFEVPPRVTEVFYSAEACGGRSLGCTQFPHAENVVLTAPTPEGNLGSFQSRVLVGGFIGINAAFITPDSEEFSTITHELLHALGLAHPVVEAFASGAVAAKLVVPGTLSSDGGFPSIMGFRSTADRTFNLSPDDIDTVETLYAAAPGCQYQNAPLAIQANAPVVPADAGSSVPGPEGAADAAVPETPANDAGGVEGESGAGN